jgi:hypothetical protein
MLPYTSERKLQVPTGAPSRLLEDIQTYSAFVDLQNKMGNAAPWFQRLA